MRAWKALGGWALTLGTVAVFVLGCGGGTDREAGSAREGTARPDSLPRPEDAMVIEGVAGVHGGRFVATVRSDPKTWNSLLANETSTSDITNGRLFEPMLAFDNVTQEHGPGLAKSWERSEDGLVWTFHLRRGLRWSDGEPLTSADVLFTVEILYDEDIHPSSADLCKVEGEPFGFEAPDPHTVVVRTAKPYGPFLNAVGSVYIMPRHKLEAAYRAGQFESTYGVDTPVSEIVTCGPWVVAEYVPQEKVTLTPNPHHYRYDERGRRLPYLDELVYLVVPDQNTERLKFESGQSDRIYLRAEDYAQLKDAEAGGDFTIHDLGMEVGTHFFWFNQKSGVRPGTDEPYGDPVRKRWFRDRRFRRALAHAVDRESMAQTVYYGLADALYGPIPPANRIWHNPDIVMPRFDPGEAKRILDEAGYRDRDGDGVREDEEGNPIEFVLATAVDNQERVSLGNILVDDLRQIGVRCTLAPTDFNSLITMLRESFDYDAILLGLTGGVPPDPVMSMNVFRSSGRTHFWDPEQETPGTPWEARIDSLMDAQMVLVDQDARRALFDEVQLIISENVPAIYLVSRRGLLAVRNHFAGLQPSVLRPWVLWRSYAIWSEPGDAGRGR